MAQHLHSCLNFSCRLFIVIVYIPHKQSFVGHRKSREGRFQWKETAQGMTVGNPSAGLTADSNVLVPILQRKLASIICDEFIR